MKMRWALIMAWCMMTGCGKEIPAEIIQPAQMEEVLYDYHLSMGMSNGLKNTEKEAYKKFVFQKHQVTEAHFDSSMVWYTREAQELHSIYENLEKRFKREHVYAETLLGTREDDDIITQAGDSVNIWNGSSVYWMSEVPLKKQLAFEIKADTNFYARDAFLWNADFHFMTEGEVMMGLNILYANDSVVGETRRITTSGNQTMCLYTDSLYEIKSLNGFLYVPENKEKDPHVLVSNVSLMRYHRVEGDSLAYMPPRLSSSMQDEEAPEEEEVVEIVVPEEETEKKVEVKEQPAQKKPKKRAPQERLQKVDEQDRR